MPLTRFVEPYSIIDNKELIKSKLPALKDLEIVNFDVRSKTPEEVREEFRNPRDVIMQIEDIIERLSKDKSETKIIPVAMNVKGDHLEPFVFIKNNNKIHVISLSPGVMFEHTKNLFNSYFKDRINFVAVENRVLNNSKESQLIFQGSSSGCGVDTLRTLNAFMKMEKGSENFKFFEEQMRKVERTTAADKYITLPKYFQKYIQDLKAAVVATTPSAQSGLFNMKSKDLVDEVNKMLAENPKIVPVKRNGKFVNMSNSIFNENLLRVLNGKTKMTKQEKAEFVASLRDGNLVEWDALARLYKTNACEYKLHPTSVAGNIMALPMTTQNVHLENPMDSVNYQNEEAQRAAQVQSSNFSKNFISVISGENESAHRYCKPIILNENTAGNITTR